MNRATAVAAAMIALSLVAAGCASRNDAPPRSIETSYPSPDYPPQDTKITPKPAPRPAAGPPAAPVGRPLADQARPNAAAPQAPVAARPMPAGASPAPGHHAPDPSRLFSAMDKDHNGRVTLEEWRNFHENEFRRLDKNDDGVLTRDEMAAPAPSGGARPYAKPSPGPYPQ